MMITRRACLLAAATLMALSPVSEQAPDTVRAGGQTFIIGPAESCGMGHADLDFRSFTPE